jgi:hypothetical protein
LTQPLRFDGAAKGAIETVEVEIINVVVAGARPSALQPVLIGATHRLWVTIGAALIGGCSIAREAWRFEEIEPQWDQLTLRSSTDGQPDREWPLAELGQPRDLIVRRTGAKRLDVGVALFCGAPSWAAPTRPGQTVAATLADPVSGRSLAHGYRVQSPPLVS